MKDNNALQSFPLDELPPETFSDAYSLLVVDIGDFNTHALLFDSVENGYRLIATSKIQSSICSPDIDAGVTFRKAIQEIENMSRRRLFNKMDGIISPSLPDGSGVDNFIATISIGIPLKIAAVGLLEDISTANAARLAKTTYCGELKKIGKSSYRDNVSIIDAISMFTPDLIIIAGGTEDGAYAAVRDLLETISMSCETFPENNRPFILYAGNRALQDEIIEYFDGVTGYQIAPNVYRTQTTQDNSASNRKVAEITTRIRQRQIPGLGAFMDLAPGSVVHSPAAYGRIVQFLSKARSPEKGVLGIDINTTSSTLTAAFDGELTLTVYTELGTGTAPSQLLENPALLEIFLHWLPMDIPAGYVYEFLQNKLILPTYTPTSHEDLIIEQTLIRYIIQTAIQKSRTALQNRSGSGVSDHVPFMEPILASGEVFNNGTTPAQRLLMLLDGIQPCGATTFVLDPHRIIPALGAAAETNPTLAIQVLDSSAFTHLGTVISPFGDAKPDTPILRANLVDEGSYQSQIELVKGDIDWIPLEVGRAARLQLHPLQKVDIGMGGPGIGGTLLVKGGAQGIIFDGRGRPIVLPEDPEQRFAAHQKWLRSLGG